MCSVFPHQRAALQTDPPHHCLHLLSESSVRRSGVRVWRRKPRRGQPHLSTAPWQSATARADSRLPEIVYKGVGEMERKALFLFHFIFRRQSRMVRQDDTVPRLLVPVL